MTAKYLKVELIGGLCNKLFCFFSAVDIAIKNGYVLVEPEFGWKVKQGMHCVWNVDKLRSVIPELKWCGLTDFKMIEPGMTTDKVLYKSGAELWAYSEDILKGQRTTRILKRNEDVCCRILAVLEPSTCVMDSFKDVIDSYIVSGIGVHFRTESDWQAYSVKKQRRMPANEHCWTDNEDICKMVVNQFYKGEFGLATPIYIVSGEHGNEICEILAKDGIKCEYNYKTELEYEQNAAMHWYLCCRAAGGFVGLSRSTFSNLICLRRELDKVSGGCWIYNYWSDGDKKLQQRVDAGLQPEAYNSITLITNII